MHFGRDSTHPCLPLCALYLKPRGGVIPPTVFSVNSLGHDRGIEDTRSDLRHGDPEPDHCLTEVFQ